VPLRTTLVVGDAVVEEDDESPQPIVESNAAMLRTMR